MWHELTSRPLLSMAMFLSLAANPLPAQELPLRLTPAERAELRREIELVEQIHGSSVDDVNSRRSDVLERLFRESARETGSRLQLARPTVYRDGDLDGELMPIRNLAVKLPGRRTDAVIVVGAHLDKVAAGEGAVDDWTGCIVLQNLWEQFSSLADPPEHTLLFICFAYEENNLWGSRSAVNQLRDQGVLTRVRAMVNLECLGVSNLHIWENGSSPNLIRTAEHVARHVSGVQITSRPLSNVGADSVPFLNAGIPAITIDGLSAADFGKIHSSMDRVDSIHQGRPDGGGYDHLEDAYRFAFDYLVTLDQTLGGDPQGAERAGLRRQLPLRSFHPHADRAQPKSAAPRTRSGADRAGNTGDDVAAAKAAVNRANRQWERSLLDWNKALRHGDKEAAARARQSLGEVYATDAVLITPDAGIIQGRAAALDYFTGLASVARDLRLDTVELAVGRNGLAYERGTYVVQIGSDPPEHGSSYVVWRLTKENAGLVARFSVDTWYPDELIVPASSHTIRNGD